MNFRLICHLLSLQVVVKSKAESIFCFFTSRFCLENYAIRFITFKTILFKLSIKPCCNVMNHLKIFQTSSIKTNDCPVLGGIFMMFKSQIVPQVTKAKMLLTEPLLKNVLWRMTLKWQKYLENALQISGHADFYFSWAYTHCRA